MSLGNLFRYAAFKDIIDIGVPLEEYVDILMGLTANITVQQGRDEEGRPMFSVGGIKVVALGKEEVEKYKILK